MRVQVTVATGKTSSREFPPPQPSPFLYPPPFHAPYAAGGQMRVYRRARTSVYSHLALSCERRRGAFPISAIVKACMHMQRHYVCDAVSCRWCSP
uniref:Uncharacterized protein n=1 Tax=Leishmania guyanensis TaxID=5670 RepID=A0A1E1IQY9_LEIGU|nr:Hypothetical protein BN36_1111920 [Leishmania guyanensis]